MSVLAGREQSSVVCDTADVHCDPADEHDDPRAAEQQDGFASSQILKIADNTNSQTVSE